MTRSTLILLALALALLLAFLLTTFERASMPRPGRSTPPQPETSAVRGEAEIARSGGVEIRDDGLVATWFAPASATVPGPALLVLGGSEGGKAMSARMASALHPAGYATLALAYFGDEDLPEQLQGIPLEYFERALDWLAKQPGVDPSRIGVVGASKGAEAALLLASRDRRVRAVIAFTPTDHAWQSVDWNGWSDTPSWTAAGKPVPYLRYSPFDPAAGLRVMYDRSVDEASSEARRAARIPLELAQASVLLVAGEKDALWGAAEASNRIEATLAAAGYPHEVLVLRYPDAGHVLFIGGTLGVDDAVLERILPMGGTPEGVVAAINDAWSKSLAFLERNLGRDGNRGTR